MNKETACYETKAVPVVGIVLYDYEWVKELFEHIIVIILTCQHIWMYIQYMFMILSSDYLECQWCKGRTLLGHVQVEWWIRIRCICIPFILQCCRICCVMSVIQYNTDMKCVVFATIYSHHVRICYTVAKNITTYWCHEWLNDTCTTYKLAVEIFRRDISLWWRYIK